TITGYDVVGRVRGSNQVIGGQTYGFSYSYNRAGALKSTTYPSGRVVTNSFDAANRLSQVAGSLGGVNTTYMSSISYAAHGALAGHTFGNQVARTYSYNTLLQPSEMKDMVSGQPLLDHNLTWGTSGANNGS